MQIQKVSLVVPVRNEAESIEKLIGSIARQTFPLDEVILVDGGSTDATVDIVEQLAKGDPALKLIKVDRATPGKGRNIGIEAARNDWIALTDAGITLEPTWLEELIKAADGADIVYGEVEPVIKNFFDKCAALSYVPPKRPDGIRTTFIASSLLKKELWTAVAGFPDLRAAEDLMFIDQAKELGFRSAVAPAAIVHWQLRPNIASTFRRFKVYSKHNVWAGRQWDWHHGILKQYLLLVPFLILAAFHSYWWLLVLPVWLAGRSAKRIYAHVHEWGRTSVFDPALIAGVAGLTIIIDSATMIGWVQALFVREAIDDQEAREGNDAAE